ncbi:P-loop containing nucleoside triphosphate hydrolase protein [Pisolithus thermaeus]|nr:P-loop containing nucleoside triphosphate hydrolase protein [Pisolithus thermaeus]
MDPYKRSRYEQHGIDAKIVVMGNTAIIHSKQFDPRNMTSTTGAFFVTKKVYVGGLKVSLQLWDTAGQERFRSMAPMYYRGANAALLLYDITNAASFDDVRGWLEELKKNCSPDLIIYIVGSKADLHRQRQVTSDLARLSLHNWFPPPRPPSPPPPPPPPSSTFPYIRPRFTSFTSIRSVPLNNTSTKSSPPHSASYLDPAVSTTSALQHSSVGFSRSKTTGGLSQHKPKATSLHRSRTVVETARSDQSRYGGNWNDATETSSNSLPEDEEFEDDQEWGLQKGMELFEVSAKDDLGIQTLFDSLIAAIIERRDVIDHENELKKRDSVFLSPTGTPTCNGQDEDGTSEKMRVSGGGAAVLRDEAVMIWIAHVSIVAPATFKAGRSHQYFLLSTYIRR